MHIYIYMYTYKVLITWRSLLVHGGSLFFDIVEFSGFSYDLRKEKSRQFLRNCFYAVFWYELVPLPCHL